MATTQTPNMGLVVPGVGTEIGPNWANEVNADLSVLDSHNHSSGQGVQVPSAGININGDLAFNDFNATILRSARFFSQTVPLALSTDVGCIYVSGVDLYYNDVSGNQIRITQAAAVAGASGTITGLPSGTASAAYNSGSQTFIFQSAMNTPANIDGASFILRNLSASSNGYTLNPPTAMATNYSVTFPITPAATSVMTMASSGNMGTATLDPNSLSISGGVLGVIAAALVPPGVISAYGGTSAPTGYLLCDGTSYLRATYPSLYTAIGNAYGSADSTHFNVPDLRGLFARGVDNGAGNDPNTLTRTTANTGGNSGDNVGSLQADAFQGHWHLSGNTTNTFGSGTTPALATFAAGASTSAFAQSPTTDGVNGAPRTSSETRPKNLYVNYIIKT